LQAFGIDFLIMQVLKKMQYLRESLSSRCLLISIPLQTRLFTRISLRQQVR